VSRYRVCLTVCAIRTMDFYTEDDVDEKNMLGPSVGPKAYPNIFFPLFLSFFALRRLSTYMKRTSTPDGFFTDFDDSLWAVANDFGRIA
jgi:hypothetical protein